jgi:hypothetical protein
MQVFGRFLSINPVYNVCPSLFKPGPAKTRFSAHYLAGFSLKKPVFSRF